MSELTIKTDYQWRNFLYRYEVPQDVLESQFDHLDAEEESGHFIKYHDRYYHVSDFMRIENSSFPKTWQGYASDTFFSGILINISDDFEQYQIATYLS